ncbi:hypothetical protein ACTSKR_04615 [Chitinibacteraceae bacterium HSL-7]
MKSPLFGAQPYPWLFELGARELEQLDRSLLALLEARPGAFSTYRAHSLRNAVLCELYDRHARQRRAA